METEHNVGCISMEALDPAMTADTRDGEDVQTEESDTAADAKNNARAKEDEYEKM